MSAGIREAEPRDWPAIWPILSEIIRAGETYALDPAMTEEEGRRMWIAPPPDRAVVALGDDGGVVGSAKMGPNRAGPGAHVATASFIVDPAASGRGVGRALAEHALDWASQAGYRAMQFNAVVETNAAAIHLWRSLGFEVVGTVPEAFRLPDGELTGLHVMHRRLR